MMALNRLALRLAIVEALAPHAEIAEASPEWPTLAGKFVADSSFEPLFTDWDGARRPMIALYVENAKAEPQGEGTDIMRGLSDHVTLAFEIILPIVQKDETGEELITSAQTDAAAEAMIDLIEAQIHERLEWARMDGLAHHVILEIGKRESEPQREPDTGLRFSSRRVAYDMTIRAQSRLPVGQSGLARLPSPLREVAQGLPSGSPCLAVCTQVVAAMIEPATFASLDLFRIAAGFAREPGSAAPPAFANGEGGDRHASVTL
jgi:hypothetical protein